MPAIKYDSRFFREHPRIIKHLHQLPVFIHLPETHTLIA